MDFLLWRHLHSYFTLLRPIDSYNKLCHTITLKFPYILGLLPFFGATVSRYQGFNMDVLLWRPTSIFYFCLAVLRPIYSYNKLSHRKFTFFLGLSPFFGATLSRYEGLNMNFLRWRYLHSYFTFSRPIDLCNKLRHTSTFKFPYILGLFLFSV